MQKIGEKAVDRALNWVMDRMQGVYGGTQVLLGAAFTRYLKNAMKHYNQVHTIATGDITHSIIGPDNIYVTLNVYTHSNYERVAKQMIKVVQFRKSEQAEKQFRVG